MELAQTHQEILDEMRTRLRVSRELKGMSQDAVAERAGIDVSQISRFESGRRTPSLEQILVLADALGCEAAYLISRPSKTGRPRKDTEGTPS